jgi:hypothetical protein
MERTDMTTVLVSGAEKQVADVAAELRGRGAEVTEVIDLLDLPKVCAEAGPGTFDSYVQLGSTYEMRGDTVVERVRAFYANGVLARFPALGAASTALTDSARILFVLGVLPAEVASDDDQDARHSLTKVLSHAVRADVPHAAYAMQVIPAETSAADIADAALGAGSKHKQLLDRLSDLDYADWRVEILGMVNVET